MKVLSAVWLLALTVLVNSYAGTVISALMVPSMIPPIESLEDLVKSDDVTWPSKQGQSPLLNTWFTGLLF